MDGHVENNTIALSTTKTEYVSVTSCSSQVLWIRNQSEDYSLRYSNIPIICDTHVINLSKKKTQFNIPDLKHIEIKYHIIHDHVQKKDIELSFVDTTNQLTDIFTKPLGEDILNFIKEKLCIMKIPIRIDYFDTTIFLSNRKFIGALES